MKFIYHVEAPRQPVLGVDGQVRWALRESASKTEEMLSTLRENGATVELIETYIDVDSHDAGMWGVQIPRARLAVVVQVTE